MGGPRYRNGPNMAQARRKGTPAGQFRVFRPVHDPVKRRRSGEKIMGQLMP
jgi:hypothetical protein